MEDMTRELSENIQGKNINLSVALQLGNLIKEQCADTRVIYTRSRDVFIPLARRAEIANEAKADLFISIHTNSVGGNKSVQGASTWTLGLAKSDANLEVAKRENSVILYEDDYKPAMQGLIPILQNRISSSNSCRTNTCRKVSTWLH